MIHGEIKMWLRIHASLSRFIHYDHDEPSNSRSLCSSISTSILFLHKNFFSRKNTGISNLYLSYRSSLPSSVMSISLSENRWLKGESDSLASSHKGHGSFVYKVKIGNCAAAPEYGRTRTTFSAGATKSFANKWGDISPSKSNCLSNVEFAECGPRTPHGISSLELCCLTNNIGFKQKFVAVYTNPP